MRTSWEYGSGVRADSVRIHASRNAAERAIAKDQAHLAMVSEENKWAALRLWRRKVMVSEWERAEEE